ncbi:MAG: hypothetical protein DRP15_00425 [Candidatus Aenigmatarchaeota archaeon]|nr:MAG: hypothetical protein DRP15_00425 [Candidatus Aenigmarchaeota archaeon]
MVRQEEISRIIEEYKLDNGADFSDIRKLIERYDLRNTGLGIGEEEEVIVRIEYNGVRINRKYNFLTGEITDL